MLNKISNWHISISNWHISVLIVVVSVLSIFLVQKYVLAQWSDPIGLPGETGGFRLVVNPMVEDLNLDGRVLYDSNFVVDPAGNTGLGTNNPSYKLDVVGNINATEICIDGDCEADWPNGHWESASGGIRYLNGYVGIGTSPHAGYRLSISDPGVTGTLKLDPGLIWAYQTDLDIQSDGDTYLHGDVRIGNDAGTPGRRLHVYNNAPTFVRVDSNSTANTAQVEFVRGDNSASDYSWVGPTSDNTFDVWTMENMPMLFGINAGERMRLSPEGNLSTQGTIEPGDYNAMPACGAGNHGALGWNNDCGSGAGCLQVCTETSWLSIATN